MESELARRAVWSPRPDPADEIGEADPAPDAAVEPERHILPGVRAEGSVANLAVEPVRVAEAQRSGRAVDLERWHLAPDDIE